MSLRVYVVGVGLTKVDRHYDKGLRELSYEASMRAIEDCRGELPEAVVVGNMLSSSLSGQDNLAALIADYLGLRRASVFKVEAGEASGAAAVHLGAYMVASKAYSRVLVVGVEKATEYPTRTFTSALAQSLDSEYESYYGTTQASLAGITMDLYMREYRVSRDSLSQWPVMMHENASQNPYAMLKFRIKPEQVKESPPISPPITLLDSHPICDGAAAVMLACEDEAKKLNDTPVEIVGLSSTGDRVYYASRESLLSFNSTVEAVKKLYEHTGLEPREVDVIEVHDDYTITGILALEDLGLTPRGLGAKAVEEGRFKPGDKPSINLSGGLKARGHPIGATGTYQVVELTLQLRGDFPGVKLEKGELGLAHSIGGFGTSCYLTLLKR